MVGLFIYKRAWRNIASGNINNNAIISTGLSIAGGYTIDKCLEKPTEKFIKKFVEVNKDSKNLHKYIEGIHIAKAALLLGTIYYIIIPVISTFVSDKIGKKQA